MSGAIRDNTIEPFGNDPLDGPADAGASLA
jgi:hypothetical protein